MSTDKCELICLCQSYFRSGPGMILKRLEISDLEDIWNTVSKIERINMNK